MRVLLLVLAACGRFGFAPHDDAADELDAPVPTCTGHDEDGDTFPGACDVCPSIADPDQRNTTEVAAGAMRDEVGDACDPRPALSGDYVMRFEPHDVPAASRYFGLTGANMWTQDALRLGAVGGGGSATYMLVSYPTRIAFHVRVLDRSPTAQMWFGAWYNSPNLSADPKIFANGAYAPGLSNNARFSVKEQDAASNERFCPDDVGPATFEVGDAYTVSANTSAATGGDHAIEVSGPDGMWRCTLAIAVPPYNDGFIEAHEMVVEFDYVIMYGVR